MEKSREEMEKELFRTTPLQLMLASCTGALMTSFLVTPLDVVKIRLQAQQKANLSNRCYLYCNGLMDHLCPCGPVYNGKDWVHRPGNFTGMTDAFIKITKTEGVKSLWSGLSPTLVLAVPTTMIYFVAYEKLKHNILEMSHRNNPVDKSLPMWIPIASGGLARITAVTIVSPLELIRTKMQSAKLSYSEVGQALRFLLKTDGIRGLWKGCLATLLRDVPFSGVYWASYETVKAKRKVDDQITFFNSFINGAIAGSIAATVTVPFDVVKTHQQIEIGEKAIIADVPSRTSSTQEIIRRIYRQQGVRGLFIGLTPRIMKVAPACAIMIATFENGKQFFEGYNRKKYEGNI